jgi:hypothetical protein
MPDDLPGLPEELERALAGVCLLRHPSISIILRNNAFDYEAQAVERLVAAWEAGGGQARIAHLVARAESE